MKAWLREPLLHFLLAGGLLFAVWGWLGREDAPGDAVRLTAAELNWLRATWSRQRQVPPTDEEMRGLVADYLQEERLAREARALGLDRDDTIIRRRLAQKLRFVVEDTASLPEPTDAQLRELHRQEAGVLLAPTRLSFTQLFFRTDASARQGLSRLGSKGGLEEGERTLLERDYVDVDADAVVSIFGPGFAEKIFSLAPGSWQGPFSSAYGFHLVRVDTRQGGQALPFEAVRARLRQEWLQAERGRAFAAYMAELEKKYPVDADASAMPWLATPGAPTP